MKYQRFISYVLISLLLVGLISAGSGVFYISNKVNSNQHYFSVNGSTGGVGVRLSNLLSIFHVNISNSLTGFIIESNSSQVDGVSSKLGLIDIYGANTSSTSSVWYFDNYFTDFRIFRKPNITASTSTESVALFIESTNNYVGIGTSTPKNTLNVDGDLRISGTAYGIFPTGMMVPFNLDACPTGWALADGTSGTPNLAGKFILANTTRGSTGGSTTVSSSNMPSHTHSVDPVNTASGGPNTANTGVPSTSNTGSGVGSHTHPISIQTSSPGSSTTLVSTGGSSPTGQTYDDTTGPDSSHTHTLAAHSHSMAHTHTTDIAQFNSGSSGSGTAYYQPYYTLIFCMKT